MAIYHFRVKIHSRRAGVSAVARAAYRSGSRPNNAKTMSILRTAAYRSGGVLADKASGEVHDFTRKRGIEWTTILAPAGSPAWVYDRSALWNAVEAAEKRADARLAREAEVTIPRELTPEQGQALVTDFCRREFVKDGMIADIAIHRVKSKHDGLDQPHAHILLTTRSITPDGWGLKPAWWNSKELLAHWRVEWQEACNKALPDAGSDARVDHRTLEAQGLDRLAALTMCKAEHAADTYEFVRGKKARQEDIRQTNFSRHLASSIGHIVIAAITGGPGAAVMAGLQEFGIVPPGASPSSSIAAAVVRNVDGRFRHA